jgi:hypothetical protein
VHGCKRARNVFAIEGPVSRGVLVEKNLLLIRIS